MMDPDYRRSIVKKMCNCCPYGYHIDVDFIKLCEEFSKSEINGNEQARKNRYSRIKRTSSQTMGSLLGLFPLDLNQTIYKTRDQPACASPCVQESFQQAVQDFEETLDQSSGYNKPNSVTTSPFSFEKLQRHISHSPYSEAKSSSSSEDSEFQSSDSKEYGNNEMNFVNGDGYVTSTPDYKFSNSQSIIERNTIDTNKQNQYCRSFVEYANRIEQPFTKSSAAVEKIEISSGYPITITTDAKNDVHRFVATSAASSEINRPYDYSFKRPLTRDIGINCVKIVTRDIGMVHRSYPSIRHVGTHVQLSAHVVSKDVAVMTDRDNGNEIIPDSNKRIRSEEGVINLLQILRANKQDDNNVSANNHQRVCRSINACTQTDDFNRKQSTKINSAIQIKPETRDSAVDAKPLVRDEYTDYDYSSSNDNTLSDRSSVKNDRSEVSSPFYSSKIPNFNRSSSSSGNKAKSSSPKLQRQNTYTTSDNSKESNFVLPVIVPRSPSFDSSNDLDADDLLLKCYSKTNIHNDNVYDFQPMSKSKEKIKFDEEFRNSLEDLNDYLQKRRPHLPASRINSIRRIVQKEWFKVSSVEKTDINILEGYLNNFKDISRTLLDYIVNMKDETGNTAVHYAVSHSNFQVVSTLLNSNICNTNIVNNAGYTCVMLVSLAEIKSNNHYDVIKRLFRMSDTNVKAKKHGQTALMLAVSHGKLDIVRLLLEAGANVNIQDDDGSTALMCATDHGYVEIVNLLISHPDCDLNIIDNDGNTALMTAIEANNREITFALYKKQQLSNSQSPIRSRRFNQVKFAHR